MESRGKREWNDRNWTEIVKMKRTVGICIHMERKADVNHPVTGKQQNNSLFKT